MAVVQISRIQHRRGLQQDLPQLASAELGWSLDQRRLFIGNGTLPEGAPTEGVTEILTEYSDILGLSAVYTFKGLEAGIGQIVTGPDALHPIVRTLQNKLDDVVSVKDFGAKGDGRTDDTAAIQRALNNVYGSDQSYIAGGQHRTINFPAGTYLISDTINIPPYTRIQGEGKRSSIITGYFSGPLARFVDSNGNYGYDYGNDLGGPVQIAEYHFNDIQFYHRSPTYDQNCLEIDGVYSATFNRVLFLGLTTNVSAMYYDPANPGKILHDLALPIYDIDRGPGVNVGARLTNKSNYTAIKNVVFTQCDFIDLNYGVEINGYSYGITFNNCFFTGMYNYMQIGNDPVLTTGGFYPYGISISCSFFRYSAGPGIECHQYVTQVMSLSNSFLGVGSEDYLPYTTFTPIVNPYNEMMHPGIIFNNDNNYSIGDSFSAGNRFGPVYNTYATDNIITIYDVTGPPTAEIGLPIIFKGNVFGGIAANSIYYIINSEISYSAGLANIQISTTQGGPAESLTTESFDGMTYRTGLGFPSVPYIENNGYTNYQLVHDVGLINGKSTVGRGYQIALHDSNTFVSAGLTFLPSDYKTMTVNYQIEHVNEVRSGSLKVTQVGGSYIWDEEYTQTGEVGVELQANTTTGDIEYTSVSSGDAAIITYNLNYFTE